MKFFGGIVPALTVIAAFAWAGPPFVTDDPVPVDYHHWEFYLASGIAGDNEEITGTAPHVEINWGAYHNLQLHLIISLAFNNPNNGVFAYGPGDIEFGIKYRFVSQKGFLPQIGAFPQMEIPVGKSYIGLGAGTVQFFLPIWLQWDTGPWTTYGGGGYLFYTYHHKGDLVFAGWEVQRDLAPFLTMGAELFSRIVPASASYNEVAFNFGVIVNLGDNHHILASAGRDIVGNSDLLLYITYELTI
jgi:hypothetical protein